MTRITQKDLSNIFNTLLDDRQVIKKSINNSHEIIKLLINNNTIKVNGMSLEEVLVKKRAEAILNRERIKKEDILLKEEMIRLDKKNERLIEEASNNKLQAIRLQKNDIELDSLIEQLREDLNNDKLKKRRREEEAKKREEEHSRYKYNSEITEEPSILESSEEIDNNNSLGRGYVAKRAETILPSPENNNSTLSVGSTIGGTIGGILIGVGSSICILIGGILVGVFVIGPAGVILASNLCGNNSAEEATVGYEALDDSHSTLEDII